MLKCGFYEREITPPIGCDIPGYNGHRYSEGITGRLYTKAIAMEIDGKDFVFIVNDALYVCPEEYKITIDKLAKVLGLKEEQIVLAATHSHTAGPIRESAEFYDSNDEYIHMLGEFAADAAIMAYRSKVPVTAKYAKDDVPGLGFNRNWYMKDGSVRTNPAWQDPNIDKNFGIKDDEFSTIFFIDDNEKPIGAIMNFACHHDCVAGTLYNSDYSGVLSQKMKERFGNDFVNVYMWAFGGNINHVNPLRAEKVRKVKPYITIGETLSKKALELFDKAAILNTDDIGFKKDVLYIGRRPVGDEQVEEAKRLLETVEVDWYQFNINQPDSEMYKRVYAQKLIKIANMPEKLPAYVQTVKLGDCIFYMTSGEVYSDFALELKKQSTLPLTIVVSLANPTVCGYVPTKDVFGTEIYEAQITSSYLVPEAGEMIVDKLIEMGKELL